MTSTRLLAYFAMAATALFFACTSDRIAGGTTTETTNGLRAGIYLPDGTPVTGARVVLRPDAYISGETSWDSRMLRDTLTSLNGSVLFGNLPNGNYSLSAVTADSSLGAVVFHITLSDGNRSSDTVNLDSVKLRATGAVSGLIANSSVDADLRVTINMQGTEFGFVALPGTSFVWRGLPEGTYRAVVSAKYPALLDTQAVNIQSGDTVLLTSAPFIDTMSFYGFKKVRFNTAGSGANVAGDVTMFPLLIRLTSNNKEDSLLFAHTDDPSRLRFLASDDHTWLPFEVESWSTAGAIKDASIWVRTAVIYGNNSTDYLRICYGAALPDGRAASEVFAQGAGYASVWHLGEQNGDTLFDATGMFNVKSLAAYRFPRAGIIDGCQWLDGTGDFIDAGSDAGYLNDVHQASMSAWINAEAFPFHVIHIMGGGAAERAYVYVDSSGRVVVGGSSSDNAGGGRVSVSLDTLQTGTWYYLAAVLDYENDSIAVYVNGERVAVSTAGLFANASTPPTNSSRAVMGALPDAASGFSRGSIDECRIFRGPQSADWIRLCYQTQRINSSFFISP